MFLLKKLEELFYPAEQKRNIEAGNRSIQDANRKIAALGNRSKGVLGNQQRREQFISSNQPTAWQSGGYRQETQQKPQNIFSSTYRAINSGFTPGNVNRAQGTLERSQAAIQGRQNEFQHGVLASKDRREQFMKENAPQEFNVAKETAKAHFDTVTKPSAWRPTVSAIGQGLKTNKDTMNALDTGNRSIESSKQLLEDLAKQNTPAGERARNALEKGDFTKVNNPYINVGSFKGSGLIEDFVASPFKQLQGASNIADGNIKQGVGNVVTGTIEGPLGFIPIAKTAKAGQILTKTPLRTKIAQGAREGAKEGGVFSAAYAAGDAAKNNEDYKTIFKQGLTGGVLGAGAGGAFGGVLPVVGAGPRALVQKLTKAPTEQVVEQELSKVGAKNVSKETKAKLAASKTEAEVEDALEQEVAKTTQKQTEQNAPVAQTPQPVDTRPQVTLKGTQEQIEPAPQIIDDPALPVNRAEAQTEAQIADTPEARAEAIAREGAEKPLVTLKEGQVEPPVADTAPKAAIEATPQRVSPVGAEQQDSAALYNLPTVTKKSDANLGSIVQQTIKDIDKQDITPEQRVEQVIGTAQQLVNTLETRLNESGSSTEQFIEKLIRIERNEATPDILTPDEARINAFYQKELESAISYAERQTGYTFGRRGTGFYTPEQELGRRSEVEPQTLLDMFNSGEMAGSTKHNSGAIEMAKLDMGSSPIENYIGEMLIYGQKQADAIKANFTKYHPEATPEMVEAATQKQVDMINAINAQTKDWDERLVEGGTLGIDDLTKKVYAANIVKQSSDVGKELGVEQTIVGGKARGITDQQKIENIRLPNGKTLYEEVGFAGHQDADTFAAQHLESGGDIIEQATQYLTRFNRLGSEGLDRVIKNIQDRMTNIDNSGAGPEVIASLKREELARAYRQASKSQMLSALRTLDIQDKKLGKIINKHASDIVVSSNLERTIANRVNSTIKNYMNQAVRTANLSSAINEMSDLAKTSFVYGLDTVSALTPRQGNEWMRKYGVEHQSLRTDANMLDEQDFMRKLDDVTDKSGNINNNLVEQIYTKQGEGIADTIESSQILPAAQFYRYVEMSKGGAFLRAAENYYKAQGYTGDELTRLVIDDYRKVMLPVDRFQKTMFDKLGALGQYGSWAIRNMQFMGRAYTGGLKGKGALDDATAARAVKRMLPVQTLIWLGSNTLKGTALVTAFGATDYLGVTDKDFNSISDKNAVDEATAFIGRNTGILGGVLSSAYLTGRADELYGDAEAKDQYFNIEQTKDKMLGNWDSSKSFPENLNSITKGTLFKTTVPGGTAIGRGAQAWNEQEQGWTENSKGRVRYQTPNSLQGRAQGVLFGNSNTSEGREYSGSPSALQNLASGQNLLEALGNTVKTDSSVDALATTIRGEGTRDYNRPLSADTTYEPVQKGYSSLAKEAAKAADEKYGRNSPESRKVMADWIKNGREYNNLYDDLKKNNPNDFQVWINTKGDDVISPEKWRMLRGNPKVYQFEKQRRLLEKRDLGRNIDPIYELEDSQANLVLQERSAHTGEDMKLRSLLYKQPWYTPFKDKEGDYFGSMTGKPNLDGKTQRVKEWNALNEKVFSPDAGIVNKYPLVKEYDAQIDKFANYDSDERKAFTKQWYATHGDEMNKQKNAYDKERFNLVNEMRKLENVEPLSYQEFKAKIEFPDEDGNFEDKYSSGGKYGRGRRGGGGGGGSDKVNTLDPYAYAISDSAGGRARRPSVSIDAGAGRKAKVTRKANRRKLPKVTIKKSMV